MKNNSIIAKRVTEKLLKPKTIWGLSSAGRASALQAEGHRFEPYSVHHFYGRVVQLVRMPACHAGGRRFEPVPGRQNMVGIVKRLRPRVVAPVCVGSNPTTHPINLMELSALGCRQAVRHGTLTPAFVGSNPATPASYRRKVDTRRSTSSRDAGLIVFWGYLMF